MKRILLVWYTEHENFGDVLIYQTLRQRLEEAGHCTGFISVDLPCHEIIEEAGHYDFLLFAGGGIIERGVPNVIRYFMEDYKQLSVPYGVVGLSIGEFDYTRYQKEISFWVEHAEFFYTRDQYTAEYLNRMCQAPIARESVDVVFLSQIKPERNDGCHNTGISIRDIPYPDLYQDMDWDLLEDICKKLHINYLIGDESPKATEIARRLQQEKEAPKFEELSMQEKTRHVIAEIQTCDKVIAMRYHVVLVAALSGVPAIPICYCPKVQRLAEQLGIEELAIMPEEIERIPAIMQCLDDRKKWQMIMRDSVERMRHQADLMLQEVLNSLK